MIASPPLPRFYYLPDEFWFFKGSSIDGYFICSMPQKFRHIFYGGNAAANGKRRMLEQKTAEFP